MAASSSSPPRTASALWQTVAGLGQQHIGYLTVPKPLVSFEQRQPAIRFTVRNVTPCLAGTTSLRSGAFGLGQLYFILVMAAMADALPHTKIMPQYGCFLIFLQIYLATVLVRADQAEARIQQLEAELDRLRSS